MEVKILEIIDLNQVIVESKGFVFLAKWRGHSIVIGQTIHIEIEINEKFILHKNMYFYKEEISPSVLQGGKELFPVNVLQVFNDNVIAVKLEHNEAAFLIEIDNLESLSVGISLFLVTNAIELWQI